MPRISHLFFKTAIVFLIIGIGIGLQMSITGVHKFTGAHAHISLLGWVASAIFGGYYAPNPTKAGGWLPLVQYGVYTVGVVVMMIALYFLALGNAALSPAVAAGSLITLAGALIFGFIVFSPRPAGAGAKPQPAE